MRNIHHPVIKLAMIVVNRVGVTVTNKYPNIPEQIRQQRQRWISQHTLSPTNIRSVFSGFHKFQSGRSGSGRNGLEFGLSRPTPHRNRLATFSGTSSIDRVMEPSLIPRKSLNLWATLSFRLSSILNFSASSYVNTQRLSLLNSSAKRM